MGKSRRNSGSAQTGALSSASLTRRRFLGLGLAGVAGVAARCQLFYVPPGLTEFPFTLGVASGDPLHDRVVLWTRLAQDPLQGGGMPPVAVPVLWEIADDDQFQVLRRSGASLALPQFGHSVHVDADGLEADRWYFYRFRLGPWVSDVGRTRTLPAPGSAPARLRMASASCQNYRQGYYTAHAALAEEDLDLVLFLGDYIYESEGNGPVRNHNGPRCFTVDDYRNRYALYKLDPNLQASHRAFPWIVTWDDHEVANNYAGLSQDENSGASDYPPSEFPQRRANGYQAWWEHMPVRLPPPSGPSLQIYRSFSWGDLFDCFVLDTRQYRTNQECGDNLGPPCTGFPSPTGSLMGATQYDWLVAGLTAAPGIWSGLAQQVVFAPTPIGALLNFDQWDGYPVERARLVSAVRDAALRNFVVLTGDVHASAVGFIPFDTLNLSDPVGSEFVATGISSRTTDEALIQIAEAVIGALPHVSFINARRQGYVRHELTPGTWRVDYRLVQSVLTPTSPVETVASFVAEDGVPGPQPA